MLKIYECLKKQSFILTMRNVNPSTGLIPLIRRRFYINYEECKLFFHSKYFQLFYGFILTMRNVNAIEAWETLGVNVVLY